MSRKPAKAATTARSSSKIPVGRFVFAAAVIVAGGLALVSRQPPHPSAPPPAAAPSRPAAVALAPPPPAAPEPVPVEAEAAPLTPALEAEIDVWFVQAFKACWTPPRGAPDGDPYLPRVRVALKPDGTLASAPRLINPPYDAGWRPFAEAAVRAVKSCGPLRVPAKYAPYYARWKTQTVFFDPASS